VKFTKSKAADEVVSTRARYGWCLTARGSFKGQDLRELSSVHEALLER
jgi:hypothetical protein